MNDFERIIINKIERKRIMYSEQLRNPASAVLGASIAATAPNYDNLINNVYIK
jgi:hypothetical protein